MPILVCRKCGADGKIENISRYRHKSIVEVKCTHCDNGWFLSGPPSWNEFDIKMANETSISYSNKSSDSCSTQKSKPPETAMSIALARALGKDFDNGKLS